MTGIFDKPMAIHLETLRSMQAQGKTLQVMPNQPKTYAKQGSTAIISLTGFLSKRADLWMSIFGGTALETAHENFQQALADPGISRIVLYVDSPGGVVDGVQELAKTIYAARGGKEILGFSDGMVASAAYWIASAAERVFISSDTVSVGSIGVVALHTDVSGYEAQTGIRHTEIVAGTWKRAASSYKPLDDIGRETLQGQCDWLYGAFMADVMQFRPHLSLYNLDQWAAGRLFIGSQAATAGLIDGIITLPKVLAGETGTSVRSPKDGKTAFEDRVSELERKGLSRGQAMKEAAQQCPELHKAWLEAVQGPTKTGATSHQVTGKAPFEEKVAELERQGLSRGQAMRRAAERFPKLHEAYIAAFQKVHQ